MLCPCLRGGIDAWDPAFLDNLVYNGMRVITFDYAGTGRSQGTLRVDPSSMARDPFDLVEGLDLVDVVIAGWSWGGLVAQVVLANGNDRLKQCVLLATLAPGTLEVDAVRSLTAWVGLPLRPIDEEIVELFDTGSDSALAAAARSFDRIHGSRRESGGPPRWLTLADDGARRYAWAHAASWAQATQALLEAPGVPILHIGGDRDTLASVDGWHKLNGRLSGLQTITLAQAGHGPHHQCPEAVADYIATFMRTTP